MLAANAESSLPDRHRKWNRTLTAGEATTKYNRQLNRGIPKRRFVLRITVLVRNWRVQRKSLLVAADCGLGSQSSFYSTK